MALYTAGFVHCHRTPFKVDLACLQSTQLEGYRAVPLDSRSTHDGKAEDAEGNQEFGDEHIRRGFRASPPRQEPRTPSQAVEHLRRIAWSRSVRRSSLPRAILRCSPFLPRSPAAD